jgi:hypothetical protein
VKFRVAGVGSTFPAGSVARARKVLAPSASGTVVCGDAQLTKLPPSIAHWNVDPASVEWKPKVGVESVVVPDGPESMTVPGGVLSATP